MSLAQTWELKHQFHPGLVKGRGQRNSWTKHKEQYDTESWEVASASGTLQIAKQKKDSILQNFQAFYPSLEKS